MSKIITNTSAIRNFIAFLIIIVILASVVLLSINFLRSEFHYHNDVADANFVIYANEDLQGKIRDMAEGKRTSFFEIIKVTAVVNEVTYFFDIPDSKVYSSSNNFRFEKISFDADFLEYIGMQFSTGAENGHLFRMKHNTSAEFPTLYFFISDKNYSDYSDFSISWP